MTTTLFPDFMDNALLRRIAQGDIEALKDAVTALDVAISCHNSRSAGTIRNLTNGKFNYSSP